MRATVVTVALMFCSTWSSPPALAQERVIGLLALPGVFGRGACDRYVPRPVELRATPNGRGIGTVLVLKPWSHNGNGGCEGREVEVRMPGAAPVQPLPTREYAYEEPGAIVLERRGTWFRVRLGSGSAWLESTVPDEFHSLERLFQDSLTHLTAAWSGRVAPSPGGVDRPATVAGPAARAPVRVRQAARGPHGLWFLVDILSSQCEGVEPTVIDQGWVPAYGTGGETTIWFFSRGC